MKFRPKKKYKSIITHRTLVGAQKNKFCWSEDLLEKFKKFLPENKFWKDIDLKKFDENKDNFQLKCDRDQKLLVLTPALFSKIWNYKNDFFNSSSSEEEEEEEEEEEDEEEEISESVTEESAVTSSSTIKSRHRSDVISLSTITEENTDVADVTVSKSSTLSYLSEDDDWRDFISEVNQHKETFGDKKIEKYYKKVFRTLIKYDKSIKNNIEDENIDLNSKSKQKTINDSKKLLNKDTADSLLNRESDLRKKINKKNIKNRNDKKKKKQIMLSDGNIKLRKRTVKRKVLRRVLLKKKKVPKENKTNEVEMVKEDTNKIKLPDKETIRKAIVDRINAMNPPTIRKRRQPRELIINDKSIDINKNILIRFDNNEIKLEEKLPEKLDDVFIKIKNKKPVPYSDEVSDKTFDEDADKERKTDDDDTIDLNDSEGRMSDNFFYQSINKLIELAKFGNFDPKYISYLLSFMARDEDEGNKDSEVSELPYVSDTSDENAKPDVKKSTVIGDSGITDDAEEDKKVPDTQLDAGEDVEGEDSDEEQYPVDEEHDARISDPDDLMDLEVWSQFFPEVKKEEDVVQVEVSKGATGIDKEYIKYILRPESSRQSLPEFIYGMFEAGLMADEEQLILEHKEFLVGEQAGEESEEEADECIVHKLEPDYIVRKQTKKRLEEIFEGFKKDQLDDSDEIYGEVEDIKPFTWQVVKRRVEEDLRQKSELQYSTSFATLPPSQESQNIEKCYINNFKRVFGTILTRALVETLLLKPYLPAPIEYLVQCLRYLGTEDGYNERMDAIDNELRAIYGDLVMRRYLPLRFKLLDDSQESEPSPYDTEYSYDSELPDDWIPITFQLEQCKEPSIDWSFLQRSPLSSETDLTSEFLVSSILTLTSDMQIGSSIYSMSMEEPSDLEIADSIHERKYPAGYAMDPYDPPPFDIGEDGEVLFNYIYNEEGEVDYEFIGEMLKIEKRFEDMEEELYGEYTDGPYGVPPQITGDDLSSSYWDSDTDHWDDSDDYDGL